MQEHSGQQMKQSDSRLLSAILIYSDRHAVLIIMCCSHMDCTEVASALHDGRQDRAIVDMVIVVVVVAVVLVVVVAESIVVVV